jgi:UDP-N-acetylmuramyl pentapeptide phosphotransferase/UDP-N-acetylglucosamine-1-phosphate transferase
LIVEIIKTLLGNRIVLSLLAILLCLLVSMYLQPEIIKRMITSNHYAIDVNKKRRPKIPEMGGVGLVLSVTWTVTFVGGLLVLFDVYEDPGVIYAALSVMFIASYIGLLDDISVISRKIKAVGLMLAGLPLAVARSSEAFINIPLYGKTVFWDIYWQYLLFWLIIVPIGVFAAANAFNMSAGYNGIESGQTTIISFFLMLIAIVTEANIMGILIFASTFGASIILYTYNRYPARTFVGDVGTLTMGVLIAVGAILTGLELYAVICILPMFYELIATGYYKWNKIERRWACMDPILNDNGTIQPPKGSENYTLFYYLLSKKPMTEKKLVNLVLSLYIIIGIIAFIISLISEVVLV